MNKLIIAVTVGSLALAGSALAQTRQAGIMAGAGIPLSGDSWLDEAIGAVDTTAEFKDHFKEGFSFGAFAAGQINGMFGWRGEIARDSMPVKKKSREISDKFDSFDGNYNMLRVQGGIQLSMWDADSAGKPYGFVTAGVVRQSASIDAKTFTGTTIKTEPEDTTKFGASFGGGYNYNIAPNWGLGADVHFNYGNFTDSSRWWWTPSAQVFFSF